MKKREYSEEEAKRELIEDLRQMLDHAEEELEYSNDFSITDDFEKIIKRKKRKKSDKKKRRRRLRRMKLTFILIVFLIIVFTIKFLIFDIANPTLDFEKDRKDDFLTVLVGVTDEDGYRTDALVLVAFDTKNQTVELLNIPRDTYCDATTNSKKVNASYILGIEKTMSTVADLVGFTPDKYVVINFEGLVEIIDTIGGVSVDVLIDMKYDDPTQDLHIDIQKGLQVLDGKNSVDYLRFRKNNDGTGYAMGDLGRIEATQAYISALKEQIISLKTVVLLPSIINSVFSNVKTDLEVEEIKWLALKALSIEELNSQTLSGEAKYINGISYYVPNGTGILECINEKFNPFLEDITTLNLLN
ncbi:MAG: LCP family protein [Clostridia bacterium]